MDFSFNGEIAKIYGVDEAVFIHNLYWWIAKNQANGRHFYDGRNWTYNSIKAFAELFPFWTEKQVRRIVKKLEENGALHTGNYNPSAYDRTQWYALDKSVISIYTYGQNHLTKWANQNAQMGEPIPDSKPYSKPDNKPYAQNDTLFPLFWQAYPRKKSKAAAEKAFHKIKPDEKLVDIMLNAIENQKNSSEWKKDNGQYIPYPASWLNGRRWEDDNETASSGWEELK